MINIDSFIQRQINGKFDAQHPDTRQTIGQFDTYFGAYNFVSSVYGFLRQK